MDNNREEVLVFTNIIDAFPSVSLFIADGLSMMSKKSFVTLLKNHTFPSEEEPEGAIGNMLALLAHEWIWKDKKIFKELKSVLERCYKEYLRIVKDGLISPEGSKTLKVEQQLYRRAESIPISHYKRLVMLDKALRKHFDSSLKKLGVSFVRLGENEILISKFSVGDADK